MVAIQQEDVVVNNKINKAVPTLKCNKKVRHFYKF